MAKHEARHEESYVDLDQPYEQNIIGMRGIIYFGVGLFLLIVITFGLMWVFQFQFLQVEKEKENALNANPMAMNKQERVPKNLQLQSAPGFGVEDPRTGKRTNLELREPQAEYRLLQEIWQDQWENGQKDEKTGTVVSLPIEEAKKQFLADNGEKSKNDASGKDGLDEARSMISASSAGRTRTDIKR